jgi:fructoselysine 3-epimerase
MKLGIATSVFVNYALEDVIPCVAEAGYDGIDIWGGRPHAYRHDYAPADLRRLCGLLDHHHLTVASFMPAFYRYPHSLSSPNEVVRQDSLDYMRQCVDSAVILGAGLVLLVPGCSIHGQDAQDAHRRMVDSIDEICRYAAQYDIWLGIEPANRVASNLVNTASDALAIIDELRHTNLGVVLDTGHINLVDESAEEAVERLGDLLLQVHVNDNDGRRQQNLIPGEGTVDFGRLIQLLQATGYEGFLSAELAWDYTANPVPAVTEAARRIRALL